MVGEAFAGLSAFKTMFDMTKALKDIHDVTIRDRAIIDLQREILEAQAAQSELLHSVGQLKKEVAELKAWGSDKERYELHELPPGVFVRVLKQSMAAGEPIHRLCAKCYEDGKKSILQSAGTVHGQETLNCHGCGAKMVVGVFQAPPPRNARPTWGGGRQRGG